MRDEIVIRNATLVLEGELVRGSLRVVDGRIADIASGPGDVGEDADGDTVIPGLVELHTDHLENHFLPRPGVRWDPHGAVLAHDAQIACSGITTVLDALRVGSDGDAKRIGRDMRLLADAIEAVDREGATRAEHLLHLRCELSAADVVEEAEPFLTDLDRLRLVSLMDHTPGQRQYADVSKYRLYYKGKLGMTDAEIDEHMDRRLAAHAAHAGDNRRRLVALCKARGLAVASHDDATEAHVAEAIEDGACVAEFPTTLEAADASHANGLAILMGAPNLLRGGSHSGNVSAVDLARRDRLDILSSDYVPISLLHAVFRLHEGEAGWALPRAVRVGTCNPARAVGLTDRGVLAPGLRGDLVRVRRTSIGPQVVSVWREGRRVA